jgi:hypothetical protein
MLTPYSYNPSRDDLWLYEDYAITWSVPESGKAVVKRPVAWNPGSPLYGYRKSLQALTTRLRIMQRRADAQYISIYSQWNDPNDPANDPVFTNSYPMHQWLVSPRFMFGCKHCYGTSINRNPALRLVGNGGYPVDSFLANAQCLRWLGPDNEVLDEISGEEILLPYSADPPSNLSANEDLGIWEATRNINVEPISVVDTQTMSVGQKMWMLESNHRIIRQEFVLTCVVGGVDRYGMHPVMPNGDPLPYPVQFYEFDSGTSIVCEIKPPTSAAAGDGVLGLLPSHLQFSNDFVYTLSQPLSATRPGYGDLTASGFLATHDFSLQPQFVRNNVRSYFASRGYAMPAMQNAWRDDDAATETKQLQQKTTVESLL